MFEEKEYKGQKERMLNLNKIPFNKIISFRVKELLTQGKNKFGRWALFLCEDEQGEFKTFVGENPTDNFNKKLFDLFIENEGKIIFVKREQVGTKKGTQINIFKVTHQKGDEVVVEKVENTDNIQLRSTESGDSEETILSAIKVGGHWDDEVVFVGTLVKYGCDSERAKFLFENRNKINL